MFPGRWGRRPGRPAPLCWRVDATSVAICRGRTTRTPHDRHASPRQQRAEAGRGVPAERRGSAGGPAPPSPRRPRPRSPRRHEPAAEARRARPSLRRPPPRRPPSLQPPQRSPRARRRARARVSGTRRRSARRARSRRRHARPRPPHPSLRRPPRDTPLRARRRGARCTRVSSARRRHAVRARRRGARCTRVSSARRRHRRPRPPQRRLLHPSLRRPPSLRPPQTRRLRPPQTRRQRRPRKARRRRATVSARSSSSAAAGDDIREPNALQRHQHRHQFRDAGGRPARRSRAGGGGRRRRDRPVRRRRAPVGPVGAPRRSRDERGRGSDDCRRQARPCASDGSIDGSSHRPT